MANRPYVFMHYSNPTKDSKRLENRQKVAKYAMLGRARLPTIESAAQHPSASSDDRDPAIAFGGVTGEDFDDTGDNPRGLVAASREDDRGFTPSDDITARPALNLAFSPNSSSTQLQDTRPPPLRSAEGYYSTFSQYASPSPASSRHSQSPLASGQHDFSLNDDIQSDDAEDEPLSTNDSTSAGTGVSQQQLTAPRRTSRAHVKAHNGRRTAPLKRVGTKPGSVAQHSNPGTLVARPLTPLSGANDPFDSLPIHADQLTRQLLHQYMNAHLISSVYAKGTPGTHDRIRRMRHTIWAPLILKSKATASALVAYTGSTPSLRARPGSLDFLMGHVLIAMEAVRQALNKPNAAADDSICFAVVLLMLTAQRLGNSVTYSKHAQGLSILLRYRTEALSKKDDQPETILRLKSFYAANPGEPCLYCRDSGSHTEDIPGIPAEVAYDESKAGTPEVIFQRRGSGFYDLVDRGLLSPVMTYFIEPAMIWTGLAEGARRDKLSAAAGATHAWIDEGEFTLTGKINFLDTATHTATRICLYLSSWLDWQHSCSAVRAMAGAVFYTASRTDVEDLLIQCPDLLTWLSLMAGPLSEGESRQWFTNLLRRATHRLCLGPDDLDDIVSLYTYRFVWSDTMTPGARRFWLDAFTAD